MDDDQSCLLSCQPSIYLKVNKKKTHKKFAIKLKIFKQI